MSEKESSDHKKDEIKAIAAKGETEVEKKVPNVAKQVALSDDFTKIRKLTEKGQANLDELKSWAEDLKKVIDEFPSDQAEDIIKDALNDLGKVEEKIREAIKDLMDKEK